MYAFISRVSLKLVARSHELIEEEEENISHNLMTVEWELLAPSLRRFEPAARVKPS